MQHGVKHGRRAAKQQIQTFADQGLNGRRPAGDQYRLQIESVFGEDAGIAPDVKGQLAGEAVVAEPDRG